MYIFERNLICLEQVFNATKKHIRIGNRNVLLLLITVALLFLGGLYSTYRGLIANSTQMGEELVQSYVADEERNMLLYQNVVKVGVTYLDQLTDQGLSMAEVSRRLFDYMDTTSHALSDTELSLSLAMNGHLPYNTDAVVPDDYNYLDSVWYAQAAAVPGEVVFTDRFVCPVEHINEVVVAAVSPKTGYAVLLNLHQEDFIHCHRDLNLGESSAYYLFDKNDHLLYANTPFSDVSPEQIEARCETMRRSFNVQNGQDITDFNGKTRTYFSAPMSNGWSCVLTVPRSALITGMHQVLVSYVLILLAALAVMFFLWRRGRHLRQHLIRVSAMVQALCNSFYAIYWVDIRNERYKVLKQSHDSRFHLEKQGPYQEMLQAFLSVMHEETAREFSDCFSLEHLSQLAQDRVKNFGGDFQRISNDGFTWINVNVIVDQPLSRGEALLAFRLADTDRQQHSRLVKEAMAAADAHERAQHQFFASMSHDMRTPLNIILGMNQLSARSDCTKEKRAEYTREIDQAGRQLLCLINDILDLSCIEQGQLCLETHEFDLCQALSGHVAHFQAQAQQQNKSFTFRMDVEYPMVLGDKVRLLQIMDNLLSNALKYTLPGDSISVTLSQAGADNKNYLFVVADTGIGMSQEFLKRLYDPYARERRFGANSVMGSGLGLTIVKNLVSQNGGDISVEIAPGKGTCFRVTLPFVHAKSAQADPVPAPAAADYSLSGKHVLVAEDNPSNRDILTELLTEDGAIVTGAADGQEAVDAFSRSAPFFFDVILMDLQMPRLDGCQAAQAIRALDRPDAKSVFILALTANTSAEDMGSSVTAGMDAHLSKPVPIPVICRTLARLTAKRKSDQAENETKM